MHSNEREPVLTRTVDRVDLYVYEGVHGNAIENVRSGVADFELTYLDDISSMFEEKPLSTEAFHVVLFRKFFGKAQADFLGYIEK